MRSVVLSVVVHDFEFGRRGSISIAPLVSCGDVRWGVQDYRPVCEGSCMDDPHFDGLAGLFGAPEIVRGLAVQAADGVPLPWSFGFVLMAVSSVQMSSRRSLAAADASPSETFVLIEWSMIRLMNQVVSVPGVRIASSPTVASSFVRRWPTVCCAQFWIASRLCLIWSYVHLGGPFVDQELHRTHSLGTTHSHSIPMIHTLACSLR